MDFDGIKECLRIAPASIHQIDEYGNNAMHICVGGGSHRVRHIMKYFLDETDINLLHENADGECPLEMAFGINDQEGIEILEEPTLRQLHLAFPDPKPKLTPK
ncbi:MAG: hypothetical protein H6868_00080 [Rhodospirillales bacterium]|nr:hypothetical protein [Rhodospirillales bacterium]